MDMQVNSAELASAANSLRKNVSDMQQILDDSTSTINGTAASWESAAAENLRSRYTSLAAKFSDFYDAITKYAKFLDNTATAYGPLTVHEATGGYAVRRAQGLPLLFSLKF